MWLNALKRGCAFSQGILSDVYLKGISEAQVLAMPRLKRGENSLPYSKAISFNNTIQRIGTIVNVTSYYIHKLWMSVPKREDFFLSFFIFK